MDPHPAPTSAPFTSWQDAWTSTLNPLGNGAAAWPPRGWGGGSRQEPLHLCLPWGRLGGAHLQLLIRPLEELNLLVVLLLLHQSPLDLPLLGGLTLGLLLVRLPLQISLFCFQFCNLRTETPVILGRCQEDWAV